MTNESHKFYRFSDQASFEALSAAADAARGLPNDDAESWLPNWHGLFIDPEFNDERLYCFKRWQILDSDDFDRPGMTEIDFDTYLARLRWEPPVEEDLEMGDEMYQEGILY